MASRVSSGSTPVLAAVLGLLAPWAVAGSTAQAQGAPSGYEVALSGPRVVRAGRTTRFRGVAYRVHGLAELRALAGARVRAQVVAAEADPTDGWTEVRADRRGVFALDVPADAALRGSAELVVTVGRGEQDEDRQLRFPVTAEAPFEIDLRTDRRLYEPGEPVHVWARVTDTRSSRPLAGRSVRLEMGELGARTVTTGESGVASVVLELPAQAQEGSRYVSASLEGTVVASAVQVGTRRQARLFVRVEVTPETASPGDPVSVTVHATTPSGAPVRGAEVAVDLDGEQHAGAVNDTRGDARIELHAPAFLRNETGLVPITVVVSHPAHGAATIRRYVGMAVPLSLEVETVAEHGGLVPEVDGRLYVRLADARGEAAARGVVVMVEGPAIRGGRARATTDAHGIAVLPTRLPVGASSGNDEGGASTTLVVHVEGPAPRTARVVVPVLRSAEVVPRVERPVLAPGDVVRVALSRRPVAARAAVVVELLAGDEVLAIRVAEAGTDHVELTVPTDRIGLLHVRARRLRQSGTAEGAGALDALVARPARAFFPELAAERDVYAVGAHARVTLRGGGGAGAPRSWAAVLVRDLALHDQERPFVLQFLAGLFDRALLDPAAPAADTLLRTALAAQVAAEAAPSVAAPLLDALGMPVEADGDALEPSSARGVLRDPFPLGDELARRGLAAVMRQIEEKLTEALDAGALDEVTTGRGAARRFRPELLEGLDDVPETLGGGSLTLAMLEAADPSFGYGAVARRVARGRLVRLLVALAHYLDPGDDAALAARVAAREPSDRWLARMVERHLIDATALADPWGGHFQLRRTGRPVIAVAVEAAGLELVSPGPDGRPGTADDVRDPFARAVPAGTPYAVASGEDELMRQLARLSPGEDVLRRLVEAYRRVAAELAEEEIGDAVSASVSEGLYGDQTGSALGYGGLGLSGSGRGGGGSGYGSIGLGSIGTIGRGSGTGSGYGSAGFARVVRERFPATLSFLPEVPLDPSGSTVLTVELGEAVTTYLVEAIVWSEDGWSWSSSTRVRVDREVSIDAPVPEWATVGDVLELPVRVANRGGSARRLGVELRADDSLGIAPVTRPAVPVPAADAVELAVRLALQRPGRGPLLVGVRAEDGRALDAVRRPIVVRRDTRRVRRSVEALVQGRGEIVVSVPDDAVGADDSAADDGGGELRVRVGVALFDEPAEPTWRAWSQAWTGPPRPDRTALARAGRGGVDGAPALGAAWAMPSTSGRLLASGLERLTRELSASGSATERVRREVAALLGLVPAVRRSDAHPQLRDELTEAVRGLRRSVEAGIAAEPDDDLDLLAAAAAALAWTAGRRDDLGRVRELVRRLRRHALEVGRDAWIASDTDDGSASALTAMAELRLGERQRAFRLLSTLARLDALRGQLGDRGRALARVAAALLGRGAAPRSVTVSIDASAPVRHPLVEGTLVLAAPELATTGSHAVRVVAGGGAPLRVEGLTEYRVPWGDTARRAGPLSATLSGGTAARDQRSTLVLVVENRAPITVGEPVVEISLPAGAELDEQARAALRPLLAGEPEHLRGTLSLPLRPLPPGSVRSLPLQITWSVAGQLRGLGIASFATDRPDEVSITPPRVVSVASREVTP